MGKEKEQKKHDFLYFEFPEKTGQVAIRIGNWKGVKTNMKKDRNASWEIYNLTADVNETTDVAAQHPALVKQMEVILKREHQSSHIRDWEFVDPKFSAKE
jgi:arylsulfatase A-like enzyme